MQPEQYNQVRSNYHCNLLQRHDCGCQCRLFAAELEQLKLDIVIMQTDIQTKTFVADKPDKKDEIGQLKQDLFNEREKCKRLEADISIFVRGRSREIIELNNTIATLQNRVKSSETTNESLQQLIMHLKAHRCDDVIVAANVDKNKLLEIINEAINDQVGGQCDHHNLDPTKNNPSKIKPTTSLNCALLDPKLPNMADDTLTNSENDNEIFKQKEISAVLLKHIKLLNYDPNKKIHWLGNLDELKALIFELFGSSGKWSSPGGYAKSFRNENISVTWYTNKRTLSFHGVLGNSFKELILDLLKNELSTLAAISTDVDTSNRSDEVGKNDHDINAVTPNTDKNNSKDQASDPVACLVEDPNLSESNEEKFLYEISFLLSTSLPSHMSSAVLKSRGMTSMTEPPPANSFKNKEQCTDAPTTTCNPAKFIESTSLFSKSVQASYNLFHLPYPLPPIDTKIVDGDSVLSVPTPTKQIHEERPIALVPILLLDSRNPKL